MTEINAESQEQPVILLVDDNTINLQLLFETLDGQGYQLLAARSGEEALRIARKATPDLILLDIMMPGIDGYETCARLKADEATRNSVVIFLTALQSTEEKVKGLSMGAMDFITKPFDPEEIIARVSIQLENHRKQQELLRQNQQLTEKLATSLESGSGDQAPHADRIKSLIKLGESNRVEFKSTLRWNLKTDRSEKVIDKAWLKSVAAFLNSDGGVLLVGVTDNGDIMGIETDNFDNEDKYLLHVNNRIQQHIGLEHAGFIGYQLVPVDNQKVLIVECQPSPSPVFLKISKEEEFYIRVGPGSRRLSTSEVVAYVTNRRTDS
ncbi:MAG: response regulator [Deltaproteobacteria bacterium]|jgi:CheY-like chemotaxis protein|nr:response regulator [Deltaproteobacteria bacterium]